MITITHCQKAPEIEEESQDRALPERTVRWLTEGAPEGQRNEEAFLAAQQLRDSGKYGLDEAIDIIAQGGAVCGLSRSECEAATKSAYRGEKREPIGRANAECHMRS
jgi:hypothetical protein